MDFALRARFWQWYIALVVLTLVCIGLLALGALHATRDKVPGERVFMALEAAEAFSAGVRRPFRVEQTHNTK